MANRLSLTGRTGNFGSSGKLTIAKKAIISRFILTFLQVISNNLIPDHEADAFHQAPLENGRIGDVIVEFLLGGFRKWDGAHFLHIAEHGYTTNRMLVFFPLYPGFVRLLADTLFLPLQTVMQLRSAILVVGWLVNIVSFATAALVLYELTKRICRDERMADIGAILFCINPASIFMTAMYTEASFTILSFSGMLFLEDGHYMLSAFSFGLATGMRSNGAVLIGFVTYKCAHTIIEICTSRYLFINLAMVKQFFRIFALSVTRIFYSIFIILSPLALHQLISYVIICKQERVVSFKRILEYITDIVFNKNSDSNGIQKADNTANSVPAWCYKSFVVPYSELQADHWNVGLFKYYEFRQLPNFILAIPIITLTLYGISNYCRTNFDYVKTFGLFQPITSDHKKRDDPVSQSRGFYSHGVFVYVAHLLALLIFGVCCMHIQVLTRFLFSSSPVPIWIASHVIQSSLQQQGPKKPPYENNGSTQELLPIDIIWRVPMDWKGRFLRGYFLGYCVIGVVLHCNFLPWT